MTHPLKMYFMESFFADGRGTRETAAYTHDKLRRAGRLSFAMTLGQSAPFFGQPIGMRNGARPLDDSVFAEKIGAAFDHIEETCGVVYATLLKHMPVPYINDALALMAEVPQPQMHVK
jgi:hypothetical protein